MRCVSAAVATCLFGAVVLLGACSDDDVEPVCGDGVVEGWEVCDGALMGGETCFTRTGLSHGDLACLSDCTGFDTADCHQCGNDAVEGPEECEPGAMGSATCESLGRPLGGTLACDAQCQFDLSGCDPCGDGVKDANELCDGTDLGTATCDNQGMRGGTLACSNICELDLTGCYDCGNGIMDGAEPCDRDDFGAKSCSTELGLSSGGLECTNECELVTTNCYQCGNGTCEWLEDLQSCPADCPCSASTAGGSSYGYLVSSVTLPTTSSEALTMGLDLDGDGTVDNKLGSICSLMAAQGGITDPNVEYNAGLADGSIVVIGRLYADGFPTDADLFGQLVTGTVSGTVPAFDGGDQVTVDPATPADSGACGDLTAGTASLAKGTFHFPIPFCGFDGGFSVVTIPLRRAGVLGSTTASGWTDVIVGGGMSRGDIETYLYPAWVASFNATIAANPSGSTASTILDLFEDNCETTIDGCDPIPTGCAEDGVVHVNELRCNALMNSAFSPDVDSDADGVDDLLSIGFRMTAVSADIAP